MKVGENNTARLYAALMSWYCKSSKLADGHFICLLLISY